MSDYIDKKLTAQQLDYDRTVREAQRRRELNRRKRKFAADDLRARLAREVEAARTRPYYDSGWQMENSK